MAQNQPPKPVTSTSRAEKLSVLSALLGPETLAKLQEESAPAEPSLGEEEVDAGRASWHRNKLLERLRGRALGRQQPKSPKQPQMRTAPSEDKNPAMPLNKTAVRSKLEGSSPKEGRIGLEQPSAGGARSTATIPRATEPKLFEHHSSDLPNNLAAIANPSALQMEHPAVIARLMKRLSREERVAAIKGLSGPIARSILHRLK